MEDDSLTTDVGRLAAALRGDVRAVLRALRGTVVEEIRLERGDTRIALRRAWPAASAGGAEPAPLPELESEPIVETIATAVKAHVVGVFHRSREHEGPALAGEGEHVEAGRAIGVIETLGMSSDVEAPVAGRLVEIVAADGTPVEYGQTLAIITPD